VFEASRRKYLRAVQARIYDSHRVAILPRHDAATATLMLEFCDTEKSVKKYQKLNIICISVNAYLIRN
jgi:hypothetical protein